MFEQALQIYRNKTEIPTFIGRAFFFVKTEGNQFRITLRTGSTFLINREHFNKVLERYKKLDPPLKYQSSQYNQPRWPNAPNMKFSPAVAATIHDMVERRNVKITD